MENLYFKCELTNSSDANDLSIEIWIDETKFFDQIISKGSYHIVQTFPTSNDEEEHSLRFVLKNKTHEHTKLSPTGEIESDCTIEISDVVFDSINLDYLFYESCTYTHSYNGTKEQTVEEFYGSMGCNGTVEFKFTTPFYIWLLEHM
jgi:hypothetical protein